MSQSVSQKLISCQHILCIISEFAGILLETKKIPGKKAKKVKKLPRVRFKKYFYRLVFTGYNKDGHKIFEKKQRCIYWLPVRAYKHSDTYEQIKETELVYAQIFGEMKRVMRKNHIRNFDVKDIEQINSDWKILDFYAQKLEQLLSDVEIVDYIALSSENYHIKCEEINYRNVTTTYSYRYGENVCWEN